VEVSGFGDFFVEDGKQLLRIDRFCEDGIRAGFKGGLGLRLINFAR
jgi:hypothetical protein